MILAILIVALIGVVAASYHEEVVDGMQMFQHLDDHSDTDSADAEENIVIDEAQQSQGSTQPRITHLITVTQHKLSPAQISTYYNPQTTVTNYITKNPNNQNNQNNPNNPNTPNNPTGNNNTTSSNNTTDNTNQNKSDNNTQNTTNTTDTQVKISIDQARSIASNWAANQGHSDVTIKYISTDKTASDGTIYTFNVIKDGEITETVEIDAQTGDVVGGAIKDEAPEVPETPTDPEDPIVDDYPSDYDDPEDY